VYQEVIPFPYLLIPQFLAYPYLFALSEPLIFLHSLIDFEPSLITVATSSSAVMICTVGISMPIFNLTCHSHRKIRWR